MLYKSTIPLSALIFLPTPVPWSLAEDTASTLPSSSLPSVPRSVEIKISLRWESGLPLAVNVSSPVFDLTSRLLTSLVVFSHVISGALTLDVSLKTEESSSALTKPSSSP